MWHVTIWYSILKGHMIKYGLLFRFFKIILTFPFYQKHERSSRVWEITVFHVWTILFLAVLYPVSKIRQKVYCEVPNFCPSPSQTCGPDSQLTCWCPVQLFVLIFSVVLLSRFVYVQNVDFLFLLFPDRKTWRWSNNVVGHKRVYENETNWNLL